MTLELYASSGDEAIGTAFPELHQAAESTLWILPEGPSWESRDVQQVLTAFPGLRCVIWFASDGGAHTPAIKNRLRAFGNYRGLAENVVVERTLSYPASKTLVYSDVAWLNSEHSESLTSFLSRSTAGADSTLAFISDDERSVEKWSKAVIGLEWLWLLGTYELTVPESPLNTHQVLAAYIGLTIKSRGVAGLVFDVHGKPGLAFFGAVRVLEAAVNRITDNNWKLEKSVFERWYRDGLHFRAAP
jgi:hypothetical protein